MDSLLLLPVPPIIIGSGIEVGLLVVGIALSYIAGLLLTPKGVRNSTVRKPTSPVLAERGAFIPYIIGTHRLGCVFAWSGKPVRLNVGTAGLKITAQPGWHLICVGPVKRLIHIYERGKIIYPLAGESILDSATTKSGATITLKYDKSQFQIFWGDSNPAGAGQTSITLGALTDGGTSLVGGFPNVCSILWNHKTLPVANQWPEMNYEVEVRPKDTGALSGTAWNDGVAATGTGAVGRKNNGSNPIHAIAQIMLGTYPHGIGIPVGNLDLTFFNAMQAICTTEGLVSNIVCQNGDKASDAVNGILADIGAVIPQVGDKLIVFLIRKETSVPVLTTDTVQPPLTEKIFLQGDLPTNRVSYLYKARELAFRDNDVTIDDDTVNLGRLKSTQIPLDSVIDLDIANLVVDRKQAENLVSVKTYKVTAGRQGRALSPGQVFSTPELGQVRIVSVSRPDVSSTIEMECVSDIYSPVAGTGGAGLREVESLTPLQPVYPDAGLFIWIVPYEFMPFGADFGDAYVQFFPIRSDDYIQQENINISFDTIFNYLKSNNAVFTQGLLTTEIRPGVYWDPVLPISGDTTQVEINIESFTLTDETGAPRAAADLDFDLDQFSDLTNYPERWRSGENCCAIEDQAGVFREVIYFKSISASTNAHCYYLNGILRNRMIKEVTPGSEYSGRVVLFRKDDISPSKIPNPTVGAMWSPGNAMQAQTNAIGMDGVVNTVVGNGHVTKRLYASFAPLPPANFRSGDADSGFQRYSWASASDLTFKWTNRPILAGIGVTAGTQLAGIACAAATVPMDGSLIIKVYDNAVNLNLKRTFTLTSGVSQVYTHAQLITDFGAVLAGVSTVYVTFQCNVNGFFGVLVGQTFGAR